MSYSVRLTSVHSVRPAPGNLLAPRTFRRAAVSLAVGAAGSVLISALIVWLSPLKEVTPEILERTRPTILDLAIAVLSGVVGAYVTITRRGGVIAGVAIATALMPPLAVTGFGLATQAWSIAQGSALLFLTNVVAIVGAVFVVARRYGFGPAERRGARWEEIALIVAILALATPLALSLHGIVVEASETQRARSAIEQVFGQTSPEITSLSVSLEHDQITEVSAVVVTRRFVPLASEAVQKKLGASVLVHVEQLLTARGLQPVTPSDVALANKATLNVAPASQADPEARLADSLRDIATVDEIQRNGPVLRALVRLNRPAELAEYQSLEQAAQRFFPGLTLEMAPPYSDPPPITFAKGASELAPEADREVQAIAWAFQRWGFDSAVVIGSASTGRNGPSGADHDLAMARARTVATRLQALGLKSVETREAVPATASRDPAQSWIAEVRPATQARAQVPQPSTPARKATSTSSANSLTPP